ncbi:hypothetical protein D0T85_08280 [Bacteroides sp. 519]|nr:hypothetical protein [Bacteroides sp. 519]
MDYKHIEQLLERYWQCKTTREEEIQLREFFMSSNIPEELKVYRDIFVYQSVQQEVKISSDFEERLFDAIEQSSYKIKKVSFVAKIAPLFRAAVFVGTFLLVSNLTQRSMFKDEALNYEYEEGSSTPAILTEGSVVQSIDTMRVELKNESNSNKSDTILDVISGLK